MFSLAVISALIAALAIGANGQNMTMGPVDTMDTNSTMSPGQPEPSMAPVDAGNVTSNDPDDNNATMMVPMTTDMPVDMTTDDMPVDANATAPPQPMTTDAEETTTIAMTTVETTTSSNCIKPPGRLDEIFRYTNTPEFTELSANTQILVYEVLAAVEGCKMANFVTAETAERIFRMLGELPVRYVYTFMDYMATALQNEGVIGPS